MLKLLSVAAEIVAGFSRWFFATRIPLWLGTVACLVFILWGVSQCGQRAGAQKALEKATAARELAEMNLKTCKANTTALEGAVAASKASMQAVEDEGKKRLAASEKALSKALRGRQEAERIALDLASAVDGADTCTRVLNVDQKLLRSLR